MIPSALSRNQALFMVRAVVEKIPGDPTEVEHNACQSVPMVPGTGISSRPDDQDKTTNECACFRLALLDRRVIFIKHFRLFGAIHA